MSPIRGVRSFFSPSFRCTRSRRVWPPRVNPIGARAGSAYLPCKEIELGSSPRCSTKLFPDHPTVGAPVVTREIQVRVLVGEPMLIEIIEEYFSILLQPISEPMPIAARSQASRICLTTSALLISRPIPNPRRHHHWPA